MQRTLRLHIPISHVENCGRMIDANVRSLPEGTARGRARGRANEQTVQAERPPQICVVDSDTLPRFICNSVAPLVNMALHPPDRPHSPASERQSAFSIPIPRCRHDKSAALRSSDDSLQSVSNPTRVRAGRIATVRFRWPKRDAGRVDAPRRPAPSSPRCTGRVAGGPHRADLLSAPYPGIVVSARPVATIRIAPRPASTPNVELVTP